jgi:hypothetical protein
LREKHTQQKKKATLGGIRGRVARFLLTQYTKTGKKYTKLPTGHIKNGRKIFQMTLKFTNIFYSNALQNVPKLGFLVYHLATLTRG